MDMTRTASYALIRAAGTIESADEVDTLVSALEFVPDDDDLVVDLSDVEVLAVRCAAELRSALVHRLRWSDAIVVSSNLGVTRQLVEGEVDRAVPIVHDLQLAGGVMRARRGVASLRASH